MPLHLRPQHHLQRLPYHDHVGVEQLLVTKQELVTMLQQADLLV